MLLFRHAQLVLRNLSIHPDIKAPENKLALVQAEKDVQNDLARLEILKPRINRRFERFEQLMKDRDARKASGQIQKHESKSSVSDLKSDYRHRRMPSDPTVAGNTETLAADDNKDLAVRLAHKELRRRAVARKATRQAGISEEVEQGRRTAGLWGNWEAALANNDKENDGDTLFQQMQNVRLQAEGSKTNGANHPTPLGSSQSSYKYPIIPEKKTSQPPNSEQYTARYREEENYGLNSLSAKPPKPPPKDAILSLYGSPPPRPAKYPSSTADLASRSMAASPITSELRPSTVTFKPSAYLENGSPLRTIFLPANLRHDFLSIASANTRSNLETCGILCGTLISNALFISKLVIPDQESTSDTCETINESDLFDYVDGEDLMVLGWIHTHPTQTCFMSSRDLHTHCGYQVMMPESIAIVCAPSKGE